jgi:hypothetical protein
MITHQQIISAAKQRLRITDTSDWDALLESWIYDGVRAAKWPTTKVIKSCRKEVEDGKVELPCNYSKFIALQLDCSDIMYYANEFASSCTSECNSRLGMIGEIIGNYIHFGSAIVDADEVDIAYWALNTDNDGFLVLYDEDELALVYYLCKEYALTFAEKYNKIQIQQWDNLFREEANNARGLKNRDQFNKDMPLIAQIMNSIVESRGNMYGIRRFSGTRFI